MRCQDKLSRRHFLFASSCLPFARLQAARKVPIGLELYSVRKELAEDLFGTVRAVARMGYECVEFFAPYMKWTPSYAKDVRKLLDDLGLRCYSTHNARSAFAPENIDRIIELNQILGARQVIMASAGKVETLDGWKQVADELNRALEKMKPAGMRPGFHNHQMEFRPIEGKLPMEMLAANTEKDVVLQLDVGTCVEVGRDPVAWIRSNPGRIRSIHLKDWSKERGYKVLFGEGDAPWKAVFEAAESVGGVEFYLIEQEGSDYSPMETVERCLANYKKLRAA